MKEFDMHHQYAGFYQNVIKRDFVSSKLFIFLCAFTFTLSLLSISYFSNLDSKSNASSEWVSRPTSSLNTLGPTVAPKIKEVSKEKENVQKIVEVLFHQKAVLLTPSFKKPVGSAEKITVSYMQPPLILPPIPKFNIDLNTEAKKAAPASPSQLTVVDFKIKKSLLKDTKQAGLSRYLTNELTRAFSEKLDIRKVRPGDRFTILYHKHASGKKVQNDQILAAKYISKRNKVIKIVRLNEGPHQGTFFPLDKLQEAILPKSTVSLLRKPVKNGRVSSPFHPHRFHPILKRYRAHLGVDYAAAPGAPIMASGNGKIVFAGRQHGYGNLIVIQHDKKYSTRYGHMARFAKVKVGSTVKQGQVIGYVGKTGYATGHHVHYEIRINGKAYNPLTVALPNSRKATPVISTQHRKEIASKAKILFAKMEELNKNRKNG